MTSLKQLQSHLRHPSEWLVAVILATATAGFLLLLGGLKMSYQGAIVIGLIGLVALAFLPNRRILLVAAIAFFHPLSLEKAFPIFGVPHPGFIPPHLMISTSDIALVLLIVLMILEAVTTGARPFYWPAAATPLALLCGWVIIGFCFIQPSPDGVLQVQHWVKLCVAIVVFTSAIRTREELLFILAVLALTVLLQGLAVISTVITHKRLLLTAGLGEPLLELSGGGIRGTGTVGQPNQQAQFHTFLTIPLLGLCWLRHSWWRTAAMVAIAVSFVGCVLTFSRAAWLAWVLAAALAMLFAHREGLMTRRLWGYIVAVALAGMVGLLAMSKPILNRLSPRSDEGASASRLRMAHTALKYIGENPIWGVGPGNFVEHSIGPGWVDRLPHRWLPRDTAYVSPANEGLEMYRYELRGRMTFFPIVVHNKFLLVASELGLVGLALFLWYEWRVFKECLIALRARQPVAHWTGVGLCAAFGASLWFFQFDMFYDDKPVITLFLMNALAIAAARITAREKALES